MKIDYNDRQVEAYALVMKKEYALEILKGSKTVEFRTTSKKYDGMFLDKTILKINETLRKQGRDDECESPFRTDIEAIHFYPYNNSWHLDVAIDEIGIVEISEEGAKFLAEEFGCHEFDDEWQQFADLPEDEIPLVYYIHICEVISHQGLD